MHTMRSFAPERLTAALKPNLTVPCEPREDGFPVSIDGSTVTKARANTRQTDLLSVHLGVSANAANLVGAGLGLMLRPSVSSANDLLVVPSELCI